MIVEISRNIADALAGSLSGVTGINDALDAMWAGSLKDSGDTQPPDVTVYDQTRNGPVARGQSPAGSGTKVNVALQSYRPEAAFMVLNGGPRNGTATVLVWPVLDNSDSAGGVEDESYYLRAILLSWGDYCQTQAVWTRNGVTVMPGHSDNAEIEYIEVKAQRDDSKVTGGWLIPLRIRDNNP